MTRKIKIITPYWPTAHFPDRGNFVYQQCFELIKRGYGVDLFYYERQSLIKTVNRGVPRKINDVNFSFRQIRYRSIINGSLLDSCKIAWHFRKFKENFNRRDILFVHTISPFVFGIFSIRSFFKTFVWIHGSDYRKLYYQSIFRRLYDFLMNKTEVEIIVPTVSFFDFIPINFSATVHCIPSIINTAEINSAYKPNIAKEFDFIFVANNNYTKGSDLFLLAFEKLLQLDSRRTGIIIGNGYDHSKRLENLWFIPRLEQDELHVLMQRSRVLVNCSREEALGQVVLEGMLLGIPCVVTKSGGPESINYDTQLVAELTVDDIVDKMQKALYTFSKLDKITKRKLHALSICEPSVVMEKIEDLIR